MEKKLTFSDKTLAFDGRSRELALKIDDVLVFPEGILVLFSWRADDNRNIALYDFELNEIWLIEPLAIAYPNKQFSSIYESEGKAMTYNTTGWSCEIDLKTGIAEPVLFIR